MSNLSNGSSTPIQGRPIIASLVGRVLDLDLLLHIED